MGNITLEQRIDEEIAQQLLHEKRKKQAQSGWAPFVLDAIIAAIVLCVFALFHHVIPFTGEQPQPVTPPTHQDTTVPSQPADAHPFADKFTDTVVKTENSYTSQNIAITVEKRTQGSDKSLVTYYVADVYLRSTDYFRTAFAQDKFGQGIKEDLLPIANRHNAILATSGDYYGMHANRSVIRNGTVYRQKSGDGDVCVLYRDGTMKIVYDKEKFDAAAEVEKGAWQAWSFGPSLFKENGDTLTSYSGYLASKHPRCAIGYYEPGHYVFVLVDGRADNYSAGLTMVALSNLMKELNCTVAYNLDGGQTAQMAFDGNIVNQPYKNGRVVSDILYIGEVE